MASSSQIQPTPKMVDVIRLIPAFPNEISHQILSSLSFFDVVAAYFVANNWRQYLENDDALRRSMFRLPKLLDGADEATRRDHISTLWNKLKVNTGEKSDDKASSFWDLVAINPLLYASKARYPTNTGLEYTLDTRQLLENSMNLKMRPHSWRVVRKLLFSRSLTYPPVTAVRVRNDTTRPSKNLYGGSRSKIIAPFRTKVSPAGYRLGTYGTKPNSIVLLSVPNY
ncbi:hypothetical protein FB567DRAFT_553654 [Paraphoma chrysanthemicola]|uniref:F-box domain-containing protein n=1 Tax=Paraphoma chrysanthemicola TaxID=798071 RepID=A0A8K0VTF5_9PLEO|nr:hypothetical protein FB567DRAFT_553654 [Paraphoma chrysanthemicola]